MKQKREYMILLSAFFFLCFTGWFYFTSPSHDEKKQLKVVMVNNQQKWQQDRIKAGMEQAAKELKVDLLYTEVSKKDFLEQTEKILDQTKDAEGTILYGQKLDNDLKQEYEKLIDLTQADFRSAAKESMKNNTDYQKGVTLGSYLKEKMSTKTVLLYWSKESDEAAALRKKGLEDTLAPFFVEAVTGSIDSEVIPVKVYEQKTDLRIIFDTSDQLEDFFEAIKDEKGKNWQYYLFDYSDKVLSALDKEQLNGAVVQDDFSRGYQSVYRLVGPLDKRDRTIQKNQLVTKKKMFSKKLEPLLFPYNE